MGKVLSLTAAAVLALVALLAVLLFLFGESWARAYAVHRAELSTGRDVAITGDFDIGISLTPRIRAGGIRVANASWSDTPEMLRLERMEVTVDVLALLGGRVVLPAVELVRPVVVLERPETGPPNWRFPGETTGVEPVVHRLTVVDGRVVYREHGTDTDFTAAVYTVGPEREGGPPGLQARGEGNLRGQPAWLSFYGGPPVRLTAPDRPYPFEADIRVRETRMHLEGTIARPLELEGPDMRMSVQGPDPGQLAAALGVSLPAMPSYSLEGWLLREGRSWRFTELAGRLGNSDISGSLSIDAGGTKPVVQADLASGRLDMDELLPGETSATEDGDVLPSERIDPALLHRVQATVRYEAGDLRYSGLPLEHISADVRIRGGTLVADPLEIGVAGGSIRSTIRIDATGEPARTALRAEMRRIGLGPLLSGIEIAEADISEDTSGTFGGKTELAGAGTSPARLLGTLDGDLQLIMAEGRIDAVLMELLGFDLGEVLVSLFTEKQAVPLRCAVAQLEATDGVVTIGTLVVDTADTTVLGEGSANLGQETLSLRLEPHPKDPSLFAVSTPIRIEGSFSDLSMETESGELGARGAAAVALGALVNPLAALLPLIEPGTGRDTPCHRLLQSARGEG